MNRRDHSITIALCASLALHVLVLAALCEQYARRSARIHLAGFEQAAGTQVVATSAPPMPQLKPMLGERDGRGDALDSAAGDKPLRARRAPQVQAWLSLDEIGDGMRHEIGVSLAPQVERSPLAPPLVGFAARGSDFIAPAPNRRQMPPNPGPAPPAVQHASNSAAPPAPPQASSLLASPLLPADPAPRADTASDPFSTVGSVVFRPGSTRARLGRNHKLIPPRFTLAARREFANLAPPVRLVLQLTIDETGAVTLAEVHTSSGGKAIDQDCKLIAYKWWFEPRRDEQGAAQPDRFLLPIGFG